MKTARLCLPSLLLLFPLFSHAADFECTIRDVLALNDNGSFASHGWSNMYRNRKFFFDSDTGKVTGTTALKVRLSNFDARHAPEILQGDGSYKSITLFQDTGRYAVIQMETGTEGPDKPFFYRTAIGMFLTGTCTQSGN